MSYNDLTPQRSARTDPSMRDGDSGRGNPYESDGEDITTDRDVGDATASAELDADAAEVVTSPAASTPETMEDTSDEAGPVESHGPDRAAEYVELRDKFEEEGRYPGREEEVAARIVNKQRREFGETEEQQEEEARGDSPDAGLPIARYRHLTVPQIIEQAAGLSNAELQQILAYERSHRIRKTLVTKLERLSRTAK